MKGPIVLDFDGVLFNSAFEAYSVCEMIPTKNFRKKKIVSYDEFMKLRPFVKDVTDFIKIYFNKSSDVNIEEFIESFYSCRKELMEDRYYIKNYFPPFKFFLNNLENFKNHSDHIYILSNRDSYSIKRVLEAYDLDLKKKIIGQKEIKLFGSKLAAYQKLINDKALFYIDDLLEYKIIMEKVSFESYLAGWGYGEKNNNSISEYQASSILQKLFNHY